MTQRIVGGYPSVGVSRPGVVSGTTRPATVLPASSPAIRTSMPLTTTSAGLGGVARPVVSSARTVAAPTSISAGTITSQGRVISGATTTAPRVISSGYSAGFPSTIAAAPVTYGSVGTIVTGATPAKIISGGVPQVQPNVSAGPAYTQNAYEVKHKDDPQLQNLKSLRQTSGLQDVAVGIGLSGFKQAAQDGKLTREQFIGAYCVILQQQGIQVPDASVQNAVFDLFDRDDNGVVDMMEVICGVSLLCSGGEEDKIHAVFDMFDENGDGVISMDEMFKFLTSVFKVVLTPNVMAVMNSMGVTVESPEDLASVTALECFKTADLNHDGKLSVAEFKNWFYAPRNDPSFLFSPVRNMLQ